MNKTKIAPLPFLLGMTTWVLINKVFIIDNEWSEKQIKLDSKYFLITEPKPATAPILQVEAKKLIIKGKVSYYSWDGCLGCNKNRIMANGEQLNDNKYTLALYPRLFKEYKNQIVTVVNLDNGKQINCKVTDSGGFEKYNRIADLSVAAYKYLEVNTDVTNIAIYK